MNRLKVLDVTLRDGGCVNNFNFGNDYMRQILQAQENAGIDIIELGYLDQNKGSAEGRTQYISDQVIEKTILREKRQGITYVAMMDYGKYDPHKLSIRSSKSIDGVRLAFHKKDCNAIVDAGKAIMSKGYDLYIQPMITFRYSDEELIRLINLVNNELPNAAGFYIVDSFGEMRMNDMNRILNLVDHNLKESMYLGFHSHNNLQLSYSNAVSLLQFPTKRNIIVDSSIMGMGKGAGNLNTELLLEHLNLYYGKEYTIAPLLEVIDKVIAPIRSEFYWGYSVEYYLSSINGCSPSYASYFYNKHMLPIDMVAELLASISEEKKISFDMEYAEKTYRHFNETRRVDDTGAVKDLKEKLQNKNVLLIAPGQSIISEKQKIDACISGENTVSISLNNFEYLSDYILITRSDVYKESLSKEIGIIVTSNIASECRRNVMILDYKKWIYVDAETMDSSGVIALNLLKYCGVKKVYLAGFDGFSSNVNKNYYDPNLRRSITEEQAEKRNKLFSRFLKHLGNDIDYEWLTDSVYKEYSEVNNV